MAVNVSKREGNVKNKRSHALNATRRTWKANLQTVRIKDENGNVKKVKISARALKKGNIERA